MAELDEFVPAVSELVAEERRLRLVETASDRMKRGARHGKRIIASPAKTRFSMYSVVF